MHTVNQQVAVYMKPEEALLFVAFQKHYTVIAHIIGFMDTIKLVDLKNTNISMDIDNTGNISHTAITKHYRT